MPVFVAEAGCTGVRADRAAFEEPIALPPSVIPAPSDCATIVREQAGTQATLRREPPSAPSWPSDLGSVSRASPGAERTGMVREGIGRLSWLRQRKPA